MSDFPKFPKIPRLHRDIIITEKIDGTNALVEVRRLSEAIEEYGLLRDIPGRHILVDDEWYVVRAGSRKRWITPEDDNYGFAAWVYENAESLAELGVGLHYGEWYGKGIQRGYGLNEKRFALFNVSKWNPSLGGVMPPTCCDVVPILAQSNGEYINNDVQAELASLRSFGSGAVPGYMDPEGIVVYHTAGNHFYKVLLENDDVPKGAVA